MLRYAITNLSALHQDPGLTHAQTRRLHWRRNLQRWMAGGIDFIQLREKTLEAGELFDLTREAMHLLQHAPGLRDINRPKLLLNSRPDIAAAARADGVHLTSRPGELTPTQVRTVFRNAGLPQCIVSRSCHTAAEVAAAAQDSPDLLLFGPVFGKLIDGKEVSPATGLAQLRAACATAAPVSVIALGSVSAANTSACLDAGAAGIAGIRLFA